MTSLSDVIRENRFTPEDVPRFEAKLFFEGVARRKYFEQFGVLLVLATIIATAGVLGDSTATVIGAMIIAPLMTPIMATAAALVTGQMGRAGRSLLLVAVGVISVIGAVVVDRDGVHRRDLVRQQFTDLGPHLAALDRSDRRAGLRRGGRVLHGARRHFRFAAGCGDFDLAGAAAVRGGPQSASRAMGTRPRAPFCCSSPTSYRSCWRAAGCWRCWG